MIKIGLTGNIGSGKTTVCKILETLNVPVFYADVEAKKLYKRRDVVEQLGKKFGRIVLNENDLVDFKMLASLIFSDRKALGFVTNLIHPLVFQVYNEWLNRWEKEPVTVHESAILFENHLQHHFDKTVVVACPKEIRLKRLLERDKISQEMILQRMKNQWPDEQKENAADYVIMNDGSVFLIPQVLTLLDNLKGSSSVG
jgi:dephospho-CoA kinase